MKQQAGGTATRSNPVLISHAINARCQHRVKEEASLPFTFIGVERHSQQEDYTYEVGGAGEVGCGTGRPTLFPSQGNLAFCAAFVGGTRVTDDLQKLYAGVVVSVGTPGRVYDVIRRCARARVPVRQWVGVLLFTCSVVSVSNCADTKHQE